MQITGVWQVNDMIKAAIMDSGDHQLAFNKFKHWHDKKAIVKIIMDLAVLVTILGCICYFIKSGYGLRLKFCIIIIFLILACFELRDIYGRIKKMTGYTKKLREKKGEYVVYTCEFDDDRLQIEYGAGEPEWVLYRHTYDDLHSAVEDDSFFYLLSDQYSAYVIGKNELTEGTPEELSALLSDKMGDRFRRAET